MNRILTNTKQPDLGNKSRVIKMCSPINQRICAGMVIGFWLGSCLIFSVSPLLIRPSNCHTHTCEVKKINDDCFVQYPGSKDTWYQTECHADTKGIYNLTMPCYFAGGKKPLLNCKPATTIIGELVSSCLFLSFFVCVLLLLCVFGENNPEQAKRIYTQ